MRLVAFAVALLFVAAAARAEGVWRVAFNDFPPYSFLDENGEAAGYGVELSRALAARAGAEVEFLHFANPAAMLDALASGEADIVPALVETPARAELARFTAPHAWIRMNLYALAENADAVREAWPRDLAVGFSSGAYPATIVARYPNLTPVEFASNIDALSHLADGSIDAATYPEFAFRRMVETLGVQRRMVSVGEPLEEVPLRMAIGRLSPVDFAAIEENLAEFMLTAEFASLRRAVDGGPVFWTQRRLTILFVLLLAGVTAVAGVFVSRVRMRARDALLRAARDKATFERRVSAQLRARNAALSKANSELEELVYVVGHDLSSPLVSISGFSRLAITAIDDGDEGRARGFLDRIGKNATGMSRTIGGITSISKISRKDPQIERFPVSDVVDEMRTRLSALLEERGVVLSLAGSDAELETDRGMVEQALQNLIENAVKYGCPDAGARVDIEVEHDEETVSIGVADYGAGIPEEFHDRIFAMYQQLSPGASSGSGLGLAIVARLAMALHAEVSIASVRDQKTVFWLKLPKAWPETAVGEAA